jgi:two-component system, NarL family, response regulator DegU
MPVRILLVDDSIEFLDSAVCFLSVDSGIEVIGCARSGAEALRQATQIQPDLVLMDFAMPVMNGLEATRQIKALPGAPRVVILTLYDNIEYRAAAAAAGADGFVAKSDFGATLLAQIDQIFPEVPCSEESQWDKPHPRE